MSKRTASQSDLSLEQAVKRRRDMTYNIIPFDEEAKKQIIIGDTNRDRSDRRYKLDVLRKYRVSFATKLLLEISEIIVLYSPPTRADRLHRISSNAITKVANGIVNTILYECDRDAPLGAQNMIYKWDISNDVEPGVKNGFIIINDNLLAGGITTRVVHKLASEGLKVMSWLPKQDFQEDFKLPCYLTIDW